MSDITRRAPASFSSSIDDNCIPLLGNIFRINTDHNFDSCDCNLSSDHSLLKRQFNRSIRPLCPIEHLQRRSPASRIEFVIRERLETVLRERQSLDRALAKWVGVRQNTEESITTFTESILRPSLTTDDRRSRPSSRRACNHIHRIHSQTDPETR
jgi:hypothetical protein